MESYSLWCVWISQFHQKWFPGTLQKFQTRRYANTLRREKLCSYRSEFRNWLFNCCGSWVLLRAGQLSIWFCRSKERGEAALSAIRSKTGNRNIHFLQVCDLSNVSEIKSFAARFSSKGVPVHVLVNNADLLENNIVTTSEGYTSVLDSMCSKANLIRSLLFFPHKIHALPFCFLYKSRCELNFAVNVLGTYTMTESMIPLLEKVVPDARVITVSSGGMYTVPLTTDLEFKDGKFDGVEQYAQNKRVQIALTEKWSEIYERGIRFYSMHPGWADTPGVSKSLPSFSKRLMGKLRTSEEGADTVI